MAGVSSVAAAVSPEGINTLARLAPPVNVVKLGGSVITVKGPGHYRQPRPDEIRRLARELAPHARGLALIHGAGSYGHPLAAKHHLRDGVTGADGLMAAARVIRDVRELNGLVVDALLDAGVPAVPVAASDVVRFEDGRPDKFHPNPFQDLLRIGAVPVTFGDVVRDSRRSLTIASGDDLLLHLARELRPEMAVAVTAADGIFTANPEMVPGAKLLPVADRASLETVDFASFGGEDVTGTMREKLRKMLEVAAHAGRTWIIGGAPGRLGDCLAGKDVIGTRVVGG